MKKYQRLSLEEREEISRYLALEYSYRKIACALGRSPSTIQREVRRRNLTRKSYRSLLAHKQAVKRSRVPRKQRKLVKNHKLEHVVVEYLMKKWSPEQIAKQLKILYAEDITMQVSHETIYSYIYVYPRKHLKRQLLFYLRRKHIYRRQRDKKRSKTNPIQDYISIEQRPVEVNDRKVPGHWEGDLIMGPGNRSAIGVLVERSSRWLLLVKLKSHDAETVRKAFTNKFNRIIPRYLKRSLTYDQGQEMAQHKQFAQNTRIDVYFAHPHSPWERGTCENTNMLIRDFFPKGTDFSKVSARELTKVQNLLNERIRKTLGWKSPDQVFNQFVALAP